MVALKHRLGVEQLILPAMPVAERRSVWREHTAERWLRDDPEGYAECVQAIREGEVNQVHLAERFGRSTNTIHALMMREFSVEDLQGFNAKAAAIASMQARSRATALVHEAGVKELGAVGMVAKTEFDVAQLGSGGPTEIRRDEHVFRLEDFLVEAGDGAGMGSEGEKMGAMGPVVEAEVTRLAEPAGPALSDNEPLDVDTVKATESVVYAIIMLAFMPVLAWDGRDFEGGGGGLAAGAAPLSLIHSGAQNLSAMATGAGSAPRAGMEPDVPGD